MSLSADQLSPGDWAVLSLVAEGPTHGFAMVRLMRPGGEVGRVWTVPRALVYRSIDTLTRLGLIVAAGTEPSSSGPPRTLLALTDAGRSQLRHWSQRPVTRVRDARSILLLKLLFLDRAGRDPMPLLTTQREVLVQQSRQLESAAEDAQAFARTLALWRLENTNAVLRFTEALLEPAPAGQDSSSPRPR